MFKKRNAGLQLRGKFFDISQAALGGFHSAGSIWTLAQLLFKSRLKMRQELLAHGLFSGSAGMYGPESPLNKWIEMDHAVTPSIPPMTDVNC